MSIPPDELLNKAALTRLTDIPLVVTLEQLRPYELNPRVTRNPLYDDIKLSIRERGLDSPPAITRRPGEAFYIIRNGGNTRLEILHELWAETRDEQFFRIACRFRPWPARGEIVALTGHLAENELHGSLSFIERALGVEKARQLYEQEGGAPISQVDLARRLSLDGYPIQQSHISRMREAVQFLLPVLPNVLYSGLGRHQVERLVMLRKAGERAWELHTKTATPKTAFSTVFHKVLQTFDTDMRAFSLIRIQDELIGQMSEWLGVDYDWLALDMNTIERRQAALLQQPAATGAAIAAPVKPQLTSRTTQKPCSQSQDTQATRSVPRPEPRQSVNDAAPTEHWHALLDFWHIEDATHSASDLRVLIAQLAAQIAASTHAADDIDATPTGIGFCCRQSSAPNLQLLQMLSAEHSQAMTSHTLRSLLVGVCSADSTRLSDDSLIKLFRLIRLARRLFELEQRSTSHTFPSTLP